MWNFPFCKWRLFFKFAQKRGRFFLISSCKRAAAAVLNGFVCVFKLNFPAPWFTSSNKCEISCHVCRRTGKSSHLCVGLSSGLILSGFPTNTLYTNLFPLTCYKLCPSHSCQFYQPNSIKWVLQIIKLHFMYPYVGLKPKRKLHNCAPLCQ